MARSNGGIIGVSNKTSFGNCTVTSETSTGAVLELINVGYDRSFWKHEELKINST